MSAETNNADDRRMLEAFVIDNSELERLEDLLASFNLFEAIGVVGQEIRHSNFLAFLLDPTAPHGLGDAFLKRLLKRVLAESGDPPFSPIEIDVMDLRESEIRREWRNLDILILSSENRFVCAIENKVGTSEHSNQLARYRHIVEAEFRNHKKLYLYLTPGGEAPSDEAYLPVSYTSIVDVAEKLAEAHKSTIGTDLGITIDHYCKMVRRRIMSDSEIQMLCEKIYQRHKRALDLLFENRPDLQSDIAGLLKSLQTEACSSHGLSPLHWKGTKNIAFGMPLFDDLRARAEAVGWEVTDRILDFEFSNYPDRLQIHFRLLPGVQKLREEIYRFANTNSAVFRPHHRLIAYTPLLTRKILSAKELHDADLDSVQDKIKERWLNFLQQDLPKIEEAFRGFEIPPPT